MTESGHISQEDLALYSMGSLSAEEFATIRVHLVTCPLCREELAAVSGDLALVGLSAEQQSLPEGARQRFLNRIAATADLPDTRRATRALTTGLQVVPNRRGTSFWVPWITVAAMGIAVISLGVQNRGLNQELQDESTLVTNLAAQASRAQQVLELLTAPKAQRVTLTLGKAAPQPMGRATYLPERGALIFQASNLNPLPANKTYELWVIPENGKAPIPAGLFRPDAVGMASVVLPQLPVGVPAKAFGITMENGGGSATPTAPILLSGAASGG